MQEANEELIRTNNVKNEFFATMSHELRTPLNTIIGFTEQFLDEMIGDVELDEEQIETHELILKSSKYLLDLINGILDISKIESGKIDFNFTSININDLLIPASEETKSLLTNCNKSDNISLILDLDKEIPDAICDETQTKKIIMNLLDNAVKYTNKGFIKIKSFKKDSSICINIEDTGIGLSNEDIIVLFDEYAIKRNARTKKIEGSGLGLPISKRLVELQKGKIWVKSEINKGSTFSFTLPLNTNKE